MVAALNGHTAVLKLLLDRGASPTATVYGTNAAMFAALGGHADALTILLDRGVDPNAADVDGNTTATHAGRRCRLDVLMLLAVHGVSLQATSANLTGHTARSLAEFGGDHPLRFVARGEGTGLPGLRQWRHGDGRDREMPGVHRAQRIPTY